MIDLVKTPTLARFFFKNLVFFIPQPTHVKKVFLTFDDGPDQSSTPFILETLKKFDAKATFFLVGKNAQKNEQLVLEIKNNGHQIGNHTFNHLNGWKTSNKTYYNDIEMAKTLTSSKIFRPPYGKISLKQAAALSKQFKILMWHVSSQDYKTNFNTEKCLINLTKHTTSGSIVVMHDSLKTINHVKEYLPKYLEYLQLNGYQFEIID